MTRRRTAILISGRGSNMEALIQAARDPSFPAEIALVLSNRPGAGGLDKASQAGVPTAVVDHRSHPDRDGFEAAMQAQLQAHGVEFVCLAGFMRILTAGFIARWEDRLINIHPSLLPAFRGLRTHERALAEGVRIHGCTVHYVVPELDAGPIIAQAAVPVLDDDTAETLGARVLQAEHALYPFGLSLAAGGRARREGQRVRVAGGKPQPALVSPLLD
ncbi:phosphoribosylglycinamide formyltransferase [Alsobacter sp. KACC 23698]|uniref:Phosphoribosylglycinamide formyltransferase n=1 Tax=Alsobacter sp. KACC 23698 TaxID=3149229 RepID=A0AAU7JMP9_9HYPH